MVNYVNTVLVSNVGGLLTQKPTNATSLNTASTDAGKYIIMYCDPEVEADKIYNSDIQKAKTIKIGVVTSKNAVIRKQDGSVEYMPIVKWSNEIKKADIKSFSVLKFDEWDVQPKEDTVEMDFTGLDDSVSHFAFGGRRIIVRLTFKDMPHRYRKWTESYEYITEAGDDATSIAKGIANMINKEWKRARVQATANAGKLTIVALPYDDDDSVDSLNWANKVRFNANIYWTNPGAEGWDANNKYFPKGVKIKKTPGVQYPAEAKLVRDRESWAMGYQGILNRGEGTWPIIKPAMETSLTTQYDAITLEFENMYRAADDIQRKTKQTVEIYTKKGTMGGVYQMIKDFVGSDAIANKPQVEEGE